MEKANQVSKNYNKDNAAEPFIRSNTVSPRRSKRNILAKEIPNHSMTRIGSRAKSVPSTRSLKKKSKKDIFKKGICHFIKLPWEELDIPLPKKEPSNEVFIEQCSEGEKKIHSVMMERIRRILNHGKPPNILVRVGTSTFFCHVMVLQVYSPLFLNLKFGEVVVELPQDKVTPKAFAAIYNWMLDDTPMLARNTLLEVFNAALYLKMDSLIQYCWHIFDNSEFFIEDMAFCLYSETKKFEASEDFVKLQQLLLSRINKFFLVLMTSQDFVEMKLEHVVQLLSSNRLGVHNELEVFCAAVRWLNYNWEDRKIHLEHILKTIRFGLLPPWFLVALQKAPNCKHFERVLDHPSMGQILIDALSYAHVLHFYGKKSETLQQFQLEVFVERHWVIDRVSSEYYDIFFAKMKHESIFKHFARYACAIQEKAAGFWESLKYVDEDDVLKTRLTLE